MPVSVQVQVLGLKYKWLQNYYHRTGKCYPYPYPLGFGYFFFKKNTCTMTIKMGTRLVRSEASIELVLSRPTYKPNVPDSLKESR